MAICLSLGRIILQPLSSRLPVVTNFYPTCRQLLVSKSVSGYRTPAALIKTKATGPQQATRVEVPPPREKNPDVQVFDETGNLISQMKKDKAMKLARSKELKLVEIKEPKSPKQPLSYQLMTGKQLHENRQKERETKDKNPKPEEKVLTLRGNISDHDLGIKVNKMKNFIEKDFDLKIIIKIRPTGNEENNRKQQSNLLKKITEGTEKIAMVKKASSKDTELILLLKKKSLPA